VGISREINLVMVVQKTGMECLILCWGQQQCSSVLSMVVTVVHFWHVVYIIRLFCIPILFIMHDVGNRSVLFKSAK